MRCERRVPAPTRPPHTKNTVVKRFRRRLAAWSGSTAEPCADGGGVDGNGGTVTRGRTAANRRAVVAAAECLTVAQVAAHILSSCTTPLAQQNERRASCTARGVFARCSEAHEPSLAGAPFRQPGSTERAERGGRGPPHPVGSPRSLWGAFVHGTPMSILCKVHTDFDACMPRRSRVTDPGARVMRPVETRRGGARGQL